MRNFEIKKDSACLSVVVPVFNEERTLAKVIEKLLKVPNLLEIIIVDDCSWNQLPHRQCPAAKTLNFFYFTAQRRQLTRRY